MNYYLKVLNHAILVIITIGLISGIAWCGYWTIKIFIAGYQFNKYEMHCKMAGFSLEKNGKWITRYGCLEKEGEYNYVVGVFTEQQQLIQIKTK